MPERTTRRAPSGRVAVVAALLLLVAACGDEGSASDEPDDAAPTTSSAADADTAEAEPPPQASGGCGGGDGPGAVTEEERTLEVEGVARRYLLTVPEAHDGETPLPVVFDFHGLQEGAEIHADMTQYSALAQDDGFVVVFPHGTGDPVRWNTEPDAGSNPDITYFDAVLDDVTTALCLDEARVYATGLSNGAMFTSVLVCERADILAAAAPVAGIMDVEGCDQSEPVPLVTFHGTADPILLFNGGVDVGAIPGMGGDEGATTTTRPPADLDGDGHPATVADVAERNGCDPGPTDTEVSAEVIHRVYDCPEGAAVEFYIVLGGGHSWPSSEFSESIESIVGPTTTDVDATADAWAFMSRFTDA